MSILITEDTKIKVGDIVIYNSSEMLTLYFLVIKMLANGGLHIRSLGDAIEVSGNDNSGYPPDLFNSVIKNPSPIEKLIYGIE